MKEIHFDQIRDNVSKAIFNACHNLNCFTMNKLKEAYANEDNKLAKEIINQIIENAELAEKETIPMCQDTGIVTCFVTVGNNVHLNCDLEDAINAGVRDAYDRYYLRKSVADPLTRVNTKDNTPAIVHVKLVEGDDFIIRIAPKGGGSENMSVQKMLNPTDGKEGIIKLVTQAVKEAGGRPCPPLFIGIGIGGNFEKSALMAKEALFESGRSSNPEIAELENVIKDEVNKLDVGPMGLGGKTTCLDVFIKTMPCHIASLPVAINIQCHANRHEEIKL
ncbi:MAG: fumarate hydratase [Bacilli bacterium]|nr:fumarate hydratase [Bacilli bacterium]